MKRVLFSLASVLALTAVLAVTAMAQDSYPQQQQTQTQTQTTTTTDQTTTDQTTTDQSTTTEPMPATASPLPLVGLGGLASLATGAWFSRRRRSS